MGVEIVGSNMAQVSVDKVAEVDQSFLLDKENGKLDEDPVHNETIPVVPRCEEPSKGDGNNASNDNFPTDAVDEWPAAKQVHSFHFVRYRLYEDPKIKAKIDEADKELQKWSKTRFKITDELKAKRSDRAELLAQVRALNVDFEQYKEILDEKKKEIEPLQQALGKLRTNSYTGRGSMCSSEEELNDVIHSLQYRIQHESIPLAEEKQLLKEIKRLEGTREAVITNAAMRAKIQDSMGQKEVIQDQVKLIGVDLSGVRKEQFAVQSKKKQIKDKLTATEKKLESLQEELKAVTQKRDKAYQTILELRKQHDEENAYFYQSRSLINKAKIVAAKKDIKALEELANVEVEKFMDLWNGNKAFRDDYERRILKSLDTRLLSRDGRIRNPDEKPLVLPEVPVHTGTEALPKPGARQPKEEAKSSPQPGTKHPKKGQKDAETKAMESKSSPENVVADKISGSSNEEVDAAKQKEMKREEEIAKAKQALERKKKQAEKAAAKAAIRAQKEAEKKLKEREKKAKKKAAASTTAINPEEPTEPMAEASESEKVDASAEAPVPAPVSVKDKAQKGNAIRYRNRTKGPEVLPRAILRRKKSTNYWTWAAPAALVVLILLALGYYYLV
ncbi:proton pump-interactor 1 isoform X2 [Gossypium raimondii]|nr:proton pump-interactor 1 isoform X2 [Gossypium raimondii]TYG82221.1 hypothetical protein ES288_D01G070000v1 [Gossypium darwinii]